MKKRFFLCTLLDVPVSSLTIIFLFSLSLLSCSKSDILSQNKEDSIERIKLRREDAVKYKHDVTGTYRIAQSSIIETVSNFESKTRNAELEVDKIDTKFVVIKENIDTAFYFVINQTIAGKKGYSIVSGDERFPGILCYIEEGELSDTINNGALAMALRQIPSVIKNQVENYNEWSDSVSVVTRAAIPEDVIRETCTYLGQAVTSYNTMYYSTPIKTKWHQEYPYNSLLPKLSNGKRAYAGCSIIATAQIMAYHKRQGALGLSANDWNYMTSSPYAPYNSKVAELVKDIFDDINTGYSERGTESNIINVRNYLSNFFTVDSTPFKDMRYNFATVGNTNLPTTTFLPTYMRGGNVSGIGGHAWVVDGKKTERSEVFDEYVQYVVGRVEPIYHRFHIATYTRDYVSCNWGWGDSSAWVSNFIFGGTDYSLDLKALNYIY